MAGSGHGPEAGEGRECWEEGRATITQIAASGQALRRSLGQAMGEGVEHRAGRDCAMGPRLWGQGLQCHQPCVLRTTRESCKAQTPVLVPLQTRAALKSFLQTQMGSLGALGR